MARERESASLTIEPFYNFSRSDRAAALEEATQSFSFVLPDREVRDVQMATTL